MPISQDYSSESAGLFQNTPRLTTFPGHALVGMPCTHACVWTYLDRTEGGVLQRFYYHMTGDSTEQVGVPFHALASGGPAAEKAMAALSLRHHASLEPLDELEDAIDK